eukprot:2438967-Pyramimonas_sp.AAC.1
MLPRVDTAKRGKGKDDSAAENVTAPSSTTATAPTTPKQGPKPMPRILTSDWGVDVPIWVAPSLKERVYENGKPPIIVCNAMAEYHSAYDWLTASCGSSATFI